MDNKRFAFIFTGLLAFNSHGLSEAAHRGHKHETQQQTLEQTVPSFSALDIQKEVLGQLLTRLNTYKDFPISLGSLIKEYKNSLTSNNPPTQEKQKMLIILAYLKSSFSNSDPDQDNPDRTREVLESNLEKIKKEKEFKEAYPYIDQSELFKKILEELQLSSRKDFGDVAKSLENKAKIPTTTSSEKVVLRAAIFYITQNYLNDNGEDRFGAFLTTENRKTLIKAALNQAKASQEFEDKFWPKDTL